MQQLNIVMQKNADRTQNSSLNYTIQQRNSTKNTRRFSFRVAQSRKTKNK